MKTLVVGYGSIGKRHARVLEGFPGNEVTIVSKREQPGKKALRNLQEAVDIDSYDYFVICSETARHHEQLEYINGRVSGKRIMVEKALFERPYPPLALKNEVYVGYCMRFETPLERLRKLLENEKAIFAQAYVGQYLPQWHPAEDYRRSYSASKGLGGGVALDLSHELDYLSWLFGALEIEGFIKDRISGLEIETEDLYTCIGRAASGTVINCTMDYISKVLKRNLLVHTEERTYFADLIEGTITIGDKSGRVEKEILPAQDSDHPYREMHKAILSGEGWRAASYEDAARILEICCENREVR